MTIAEERENFVHPPPPRLSISAPHFYPLPYFLHDRDTEKTEIFHKSFSTGVARMTIDEEREDLVGTSRGTPPLTIPPPPPTPRLRYASLLFLCALLAFWAFTRKSDAGKDGYGAVLGGGGMTQAPTVGKVNAGEEDFDEHAEEEEKKKKTGDENNADGGKLDGINKPDEDRTSPSGDGKKPNGNRPDGDIPDGIKPDGIKPDGDKSNGDKSNGDGTEFNKSKNAWNETFVGSGDDTKNRANPGDVSPLEPPNKRNVLWIYADDLRPELKLAYGRSDAYSPRLDELASHKNSLVFSRVFASYPMCSPSRTSTLFGRRPSDTGVLTNYESERVGLNPSLPKLFQNLGYFTATGGKIFHDKGENGDDCWNVTYQKTIAQTRSWCLDDANSKAFRYYKGNAIVSPMICRTSADLWSLPDFKVVQGAKTTLIRIKAQKLFPFFLAVGFYKPHMPLHVHDDFVRGKFADQSVKDVESALSITPRRAFKYENLTFPNDGNEVLAMQPWRGEDLTAYGETSGQFRRAVKSAYLAAVAQTDFAVGMVLDQLKALGLESNTLIVFVSDHSFGLGENNVWAKDSLFDVALRVPLIMHIPWLHSTVVHDEINRFEPFVELLDLYRTVTGLALPSNLLAEVPKQVEGVDWSKDVLLAISRRRGSSRLRQLRRLLVAPRETENVVGHVESGNDARSPSDVELGMAFSQVARCSFYSVCTKGRDDVSATGYTVRDALFRYTVWLKVSTPPELNGNVPGSDKRVKSWNYLDILAEELYDHSSDFETLFNYQDAKFSVEGKNIVLDRPDVALKYFNIIKRRFSPPKGTFGL